MKLEVKRLRRSYGIVSLLRAAAKSVALATVIVAAQATSAHATPITVTTDGSWLAKNTAPGAGWNTSTSFDTTADGGWGLASVNGVNCSGLQDCIWYDGTFSATEQAYFRHTFVLDGPAAFGQLIGGVDDDATIWVNGTVVYNFFDGLATAFGPINIAPLLVPGVNLIAVFADDNLFFGNQHTFHAQIDVRTAAAPEPAVLLLLGSGVTGLVARRYRRRSR